MFEFEDVELEFTPDGLEAIADQALLRGTGARGLRAILEEVLLNTMYDLPGRTDVGRSSSTTTTVRDEGQPHPRAPVVGSPTQSGVLSRARRCHSLALHDLRRRAALPRRARDLRKDRADHVAVARADHSVCARRWATRSMLRRSIHITGTNGKGSTAQMISRLLMATA